MRIFKDAGLVILQHLMRTIFSLLVLICFAASNGYSQQAAKEVAADTGLRNMLQPYKQKLDAEMNEVIGKADTTLTRQQPECTLGNFMADAILMSARSSDPLIRLSVCNYGGIRLPYLSAGPIELRKMYELMPFDNTIVILEIPGTMMKQFCDHMAAAKGWPVSGLSYTIKDGKAVNLLIDEKPLNENAVYKVALSDYIANGGDNCSFLKECKQKNTNVLVRDALISYIKRMTNRNMTVHPKLENRVSYAE